MRTILLCASLFAAAFISALAAERDPAVAAAPVWKCDQSSDMVIWRTEVAWHTGPISLAGGKLFVGVAEPKIENPRPDRFNNYGAVVCLDEDGKILWRSLHERLRQRAHDIGQPIRSKPLIDGKRVYYVSNRGELMCVDAEGFRDGKNDGPFFAETQTNWFDADILWKIDMMSELGVFKREAGDVGNPVSSPIAIGDLVFCLTGHGREYGGRAGLLPATPEPPSFLAADKRTGKAVWSSNAPGTNIVFSQWSSPVHAHLDGVDQVIFPGGDAVLYGFEAKSGKLLWKFDCQRSNGSPSPLNGERAGLPTEGSAKVGVRGEAVRLMSRFMGEWKNFFVATPVVSDGVLYVGLNQTFETPSPGPLLAIQLPTGHASPHLKWKFDAPAFGGTYTSAAIADDIVFLVGDGEESVLFALNAADGTEMWRATLPGDRNLYANPVVRFGKVFVASGEALTVFAAGRTKRCYGHYEFDAAYLSTPVVTYDRIYVAAGESVLAVRLPRE